MFSNASSTTSRFRSNRWPFYSIEMGGGRFRVSKSRTLLEREKVFREAFLVRKSETRSIESIPPIVAMTAPSLHRDALVRRSISVRMISRIRVRYSRLAAGGIGNLSTIRMRREPGRIPRRRSSARWAISRKSRGQRFSARACSRCSGSIGRSCWRAECSRPQPSISHGYC